MTSRKRFVGGNWKCNGTKESISKLIEIYNQGATEGLYKNIDVLVSPTSLHLSSVLDTISPEVNVAVQNIWSAAGYGAYTGELTADMVKGKIRMFYEDKYTFIFNLSKNQFRNQVNPVVIFLLFCNCPSMWKNNALLNCSIHST